MEKNRRAGYQGKTDSMREKADKLMNQSGKSDGSRCSKSSTDRSRTKKMEGGPAKKMCGGSAKKMEGGTVKKMGGGSAKKMYMEGGPTKKMKGGTAKKNSAQKFAMGGVAKIRHDEATSQGLPKTFKKKSLKGII